LLKYMSSTHIGSTDRPTAANLDELKAVYGIPKEDLKPAMDLIPYLDRTYAKSDDELEQVLLAGFRNRTLWSTTLGNAIGSSYCTLHPDRLGELIPRIYEADAGTDEVRLDAVIVWFQAVNRQVEIKDEWLETGRCLMRKCIDENRHGYGRFIAALSGVQQYPILQYIALYNRKYPDKANDLVEYYLNQFEKTGDQKLLLHLIDTMGDQRAYLVNYPPVLASFTPYIHSKDKVVKDHLVNSLAKIRGMFPDQLDHYLYSVEAPREFFEDVRHKSYDNATLELYMHLSGFVYDLVIYGNEKVRKILVESFQILIGAKTFNSGLEKTARYVFNEFYGKKVIW
jgi:hypothetical protein